MDEVHHAEQDSMEESQTVEPSRKRGRPLTYEEKWMVHHVFEALTTEKQEGILSDDDDIYTLTSKYTGVGRSIVSDIRKSIKETGRVPLILSPGNRTQPTAIPSSAEGRIREFVFEQHRIGAVCNAKHVEALLKAEFGVELNERTLQRHLARMGFCWSRTKKRPRSLREKAKVRQQRHDFLFELRSNSKLPDSERYTLIYLDESFLNHHHGAQYSWFSEGDFIERAGGKGKRWCFIHAMQDSGLINGGLLIFEARHGTGDYHKQFDSKVFETWFRTQLLPNLPGRSLIVLDRCPFHMASLDAVMPRQMRKYDLQQWLTEHGLSWEEKWLRARLLEEVERYHVKKSVVESLAQANGHRVMFLPTHHPELNPIELVWAKVKNYCASKFANDTSFRDQRKHLEESFRVDITLDYCESVYRHVREIEAKYWETDLAEDDVIDAEDEEIELI